MRVAAYCRVSTNSKDQQNSFENQKSYFEREISKREDYELVKIYPDKGITGTKLHRPEFDKMLYDAGLDIIEVHNADKDERKKYKKYITVPSSSRKPKFDIILTKNTSRFARNVEVESILRDLARNKVYVHFLDLNKSTEKQEDITYIQIFQSFDERESRDKSTKVLFGIHEGVKKGVIRTHPQIFGYRYIQEENRLEIIPEEAEVIRLIFNLYLEGKGIRQIINHLTEMGIRSKTGKIFCKTAIRRILDNEKYAGLNNSLKYDSGIVYNRNSYPKVKPDYVVEPSEKIPAIIDKKIFNQCRSILRAKVNYQNQKGLYRGTSIFSGLLVCAKCGAPYYKNRDDSRIFYNCSTKKIRGKIACDNPNVSNRLLNQFLTDLTNGDFYQLFLDKKRNLINSKCLKIIELDKYIRTNHTEECEVLRKTIENTSDQLNAYRELYVASTIDREYLKGKIEQTENMIKMQRDNYKQLTRSVEDVAKEILGIYEDVLEIENRNIKQKNGIEDVVKALSKIIVKKNECNNEIMLIPEAHAFFDNSDLCIDENIEIDRNLIREIIDQTKKILSPV